MARRLPWWRKVGLVFAALVLTLLTFGPQLDAAFCRDQDSLSAIAAEVSVAKVASAHADVAPDRDGLGVCFYGQCHHVAPFVPIAPAGAVAPDYLSDAVVRPAENRVATSDPQFGLLRPPRA